MKNSSTTIEWPKGHFTINDAWQKAGGKEAIPNVTLRFHVNNAEARKEIVLIGKIKLAIGRPKKVYAKSPPSKEVLDTAKAAGVVLVGETPTTVTVAEVKPEKRVKPVVPVVVPAQPVSAAVDHIPSAISQ